MRLALRLARRAYGFTSPNPMVGAVLVKRGKVIGQGWHHRAGKPHAEIEALRDAARRGHTAKGATLYVTLEPCCTQGRTPPCTNAIVQAGIRKVIVGSTDPNPKHSGNAYAILREAGIDTIPGILADECSRLNEAFNHWILHRTPLVTVKAAMTLDGKIGTATGESKWITSEESRAEAMHLRLGSDAILVGINTVLADDPSLTLRLAGRHPLQSRIQKYLRRIVLDSRARTPEDAKVLAEVPGAPTTIIVGPDAPKRRVSALEKRATVWRSPTANGDSQSGICLPWLLEKLGSENIVSLLVEGGGEANSSFLSQGLAQRIAFFYAPKIIGGVRSRKAVGGKGAGTWNEVLELEDIVWKELGPDLFLNARVTGRST